VLLLHLENGPFYISRKLLKCARATVAIVWRGVGCKATYLGRSSILCGAGEFTEVLWARSINLVLARCLQPPEPLSRQHRHQHAMISTCPRLCPRRCNFCSSAPSSPFPPSETSVLESGAACSATRLPI
jgi:hypothetical protein